MFLRVLEFYTGVLFLTTNRVGVLDDAIKSRITWIAYYPPLDAQQTSKIWRVNIKLLEERKKDLQIDKKRILRFAKEHFASNAANGSTWNGRQIQNSFKVATALAEWDAFSKEGQVERGAQVSNDHTSSQPRLTVSHFETIATGAQAFNDYLYKATGFTEGERAYNSMERADDYTVEGNVYGAGNITISPDHDRGHIPSLSIHQQHSFSASTTEASPPNGRASTPLPSHAQGSHRRTSNARQQKPQPQPHYEHSFSSSRSNQDSKYLPPPSPEPRPRSLSNRSQATAVPDSVDRNASQSDTRRSSRDSLASPMLSPPAPTFPLVNGRKTSRQRGLSNSEMVKHGSHSAEDLRTNDTDGWDLSDEDEPRRQDQDHELDEVEDDGFYDEDDGQDW